MRIKKTSQTTPTTSQVVNQKSNSTQDTYCCDYVNNNVGKEVYSTTEQVIGTWIDGKPLYRKVFTYTGQYYTGQTLTANAFSNVSIKRIYGNGINSTDAILTIPYVVINSQGSYYFQILVNSSNNIEFRVGDAYNSSFYIKKIELVVEYTKTTD